MSGSARDGHNGSWPAGCAAHRLKCRKSLPQPRGSGRPLSGSRYRRQGCPLISPGLSREGLVDEMSCLFAKATISPRGNRTLPAILSESWIESTCQPNRLFLTGLGSCGRPESAKDRSGLSKGNFGGLFLFWSPLRSFLCLGFTSREKGPSPCSRSSSSAREACGLLHPRSP